MLHTVSNPKDDRIYGLRIDGVGANGEKVRLLILDYSPSLQLVTEIFTPEQSVKLTKLLIQEIRDSRAFYWWWYSSMAWLRKRVRPPFPMLIWLGCVVYCIYWPYHRFYGGDALESTNHELVARDVGSAVSHDLTKGSDDGLGDYLLGQAVVVALSLAAVIWLRHLFPQVFFLLGEGKERYQSALWWRRLLLTSLILSPILGYLS